MHERSNVTNARKACIRSASRWSIVIRVLNYGSKIIKTSSS
mgnify:CR=1 FL=1